MPGVPRAGGRAAGQLADHRRACHHDPGRSCHAGSELFVSDPAANQINCPRCGEVKVQTPPGTTALPTLGIARKQAAYERGEDWGCDCGKYGPGEFPEPSASGEAGEAGQG